MEEPNTIYGPKLEETKSIADFIEEFFELTPGSPIKLQQYQRNILECQVPFRIVNKARQLGISTVFAWEALAYAILVPNQTILLVSVAQRQAEELLNYVKTILDNFRMSHNIVVVQESQTQIKFDNNSRIISLPNSPRTVQGLRAHRIYLDEFAIYEQDRAMLDAIIPSMSHGGCITIFSRSFGKRGEFYRIFTEAKNGKNNFMPFEIMWTECTMEVYNKMIPEIRRAIGEMAFREQYCCEFLDESTSFFPYEMLLPCLDEDIVTPRPDMNLRFGIDFGRKINSTVISVVDVRDGIHYLRLIREFQGTPFAVQLSYINDKVKELKPNSVTVDDFGLGMKMFEDLRDKNGGIINPAHMDINTKDRMISDLRLLFEEKKIRIPRNDKLMQQLHALQRNVAGGNIKWEPGKTEDFGRHDDYVWSLAMATTQGNINQLHYFATGDASPSETVMPNKANIFDNE